MLVSPRSLKEAQARLECRGFSPSLNSWGAEQLARTATEGKGRFLSALRVFSSLSSMPGASGRLLRALVTPNSPHLIAAVESVSRTGGAMPLAYWSTTKTVFWTVIRRWPANHLLEKDDELAPALLASTHRENFASDASKHFVISRPNHFANSDLEPHVSGGFKKVTGVLSRHHRSCAEGSWRRGGAAAIACLALGVVFCARPAAAETLVEALSNAYLINPVLNSQRANLRATDEQVAVAKSGLRPNISASGDAAFQNQESDFVGGSRQQAQQKVQQCDAATAALEPAFCALLAAQQQQQQSLGNIESQLSSDGVTHPRGYSVTLSQTVFQGFQNINAIRQAKATVQAGREGLRATEQTTLLNAATAYVDVVRDEAVVRLRQTNVDVLTEQLRQTKDRFNVGEVTRTDVAQAEARRSNSITQLYAAQANLKTSRATYEEVIGHPPSNLVHPPSIVHLLPSQLEDAMTLGDGQNPFILAAVYQEEASLYNVAQIEGELLPEATLDADYTQRFGLSKTLKEQQVFTVIGRVNVPLYQGGGVAARIRQAKETNNQLKKEVEDAGSASTPR